MQVVHEWVDREGDWHRLGTGKTLGGKAIVILQELEDGEWVTKARVEENNGSGLAELARVAATLATTQAQLDALMASEEEVSDLGILEGEYDEFEGPGLTVEVSTVGDLIAAIGRR